MELNFSERNMHRNKIHQAVTPHSVLEICCDIAKGAQSASPPGLDRVKHGVVDSCQFDLSCFCFVFHLVFGCRERGT